VKRVVINKRRWLRGDDQNSMLLREKDNKMCCIGFLARELGCKRNEITGKGELSAVDNETASEFHYNWEERLADAYETNDDPNITEATRIRMLREIGKQMGVRFIFK
jgi:hypothetical protein